jgi:hypothetical protein
MAQKNIAFVIDSMSEFPKKPNGPLVGYPLVGNGSRLMEAANEQPPSNVAEGARLQITIIKPG